MQGTSLTENLSLAITYLEEILNNNDSDAVLENIKKYKKTKNFEEIDLI